MDGDVNQYAGQDLRYLGLGFFQNKNLSGYNFTNCNLTHFTFDGANLTGCNFTGAILNSAQFGGSNCTGACFVGASLLWASFSGCILTSANFSYTNLDSAAFVELVTAQHINFKGATFAHNTMDTQGDSLGYSYGDFSDIIVLSAEGDIPDDLTDANYRNCSFRNADLRYANIASGFFEGADFTGAQMPLDADTKEKFILKMNTEYDVYNTDGTPRIGKYNPETTLWVDGLPIGPVIVHIGIVGGITAVKIGQEITLTLTPIINADYYEIYRNDILITTQIGMTFTDIISEPATYKYRGRFPAADGLEYSEYSDTIAIKFAKFNSIICLEN